MTDPVTYRHDLMTATVLVARALMDRRQGATVKSVSSIVIGYRDDLTSSVKDGFDPNQPRDNQGQWTATGVGQSGASRISPPIKGKVNPEIVHVIDSAFSAVTDRFPILAKFFKGFDYTARVTGHSYDPFDRVIQVNRDFAGMTLAQLDAQSNEDDRLLGAITGGYRGTIIHELGHALHDAIRFGLDEDGKQGFFDAVQSLISRLGSPSEYGNKNFTEWIAERFLLEVMFGADPELTNILRYYSSQTGKEVTIKSVTSIVIGYRDDLTRHFQDVLDGSMTIAEASRAHRSALRHDAEMVYIEGLAEGDVPANEIDNDDRMAIAQWVGEQSGYVSGLWQDVKRLDSADTVAVRAMYERLGMWADSLRSLGAVARASALANTMGTWQLGATEKHCRSCSKLNGQTHRLSWFTSRGYIPAQPGNENLECHGYHCDCKIKSKSGKVLLP